MPAEKTLAEARSGTGQRAEPADRTAPAVQTGHQADRKPPAGTARTDSAEQADPDRTDHTDPAGHPAHTGHSANNYSG